MCDNLPNSTLLTHSPRRSLTDKPFGVNITILPNSAAAAKYRKINEEFLDVALDEDVKFILTSLGKPDDIVKIAHERGAKVYHDVHNEKLAVRAAGAGVDGLNLLNDRMGGQTGSLPASQIVKCREEVERASGRDDFPLLCAGGVSTAGNLQEALEAGYSGVQCGTRFLATQECKITVSGQRVEGRTHLL